MDLTIVNLFCEHNFLNIDTLNIKNIKDLNKIKNIKTKYIIFYKEGNSYNNVDFNNIINFMNENNLLLYALSPKYNNGKINLRFNNINGYIDSKDEIFNLCLDSYIINKELLNNVKYNDMFEENIFSSIFSSVEKYYQSKDEIVIKKNDIIKDNASYFNYSNKEWYLSYVENLISMISDKRIVKSLILCLYLERIYVSSKQTTINILSESEYNKFLELSKKLLYYIDDDLLDYNNISKNISISWASVYFVIKLKYNNKCKLVNNDFYCNNVKIKNKSDLNVYIETINYKDGYIVFDCKTNSVIQELSPLEIYFNNKKIKYFNTNIYSEYLLFGKKIYSDYTFQFKINASNYGKLEFKINNCKVKMIFKGIHSRLSEKYKSYWNIKNICLKFNNNVIYFIKRNIINTFISEIKYDFSVLIKDRRKSIKSLVLRMIYFITLPYYSKKDIWLTYDKIYKSGDCGEYLYRYMINKNKYMYYILSNKAKFYNKIKKETKNVIDYNSFKCKLLCLHSKKMFVTDSISCSFCSLSNYMTVIVRNLLNYQVNCIQHGLTMQDIAYRQNRLFDNIDNYFVASKYEVQNLLNSSYGYKKEQVKLTGIPRFDGLKDKSKNMILLSPTWRTDVASDFSKDKIRLKNDNFKNTNYFKIFNSIINNKKLLKLLKDNNYYMVFLIHPTLISNKDDYDKNDYVKIYSATDINYEDILTEAKLMITDYSGVQYDFAYMNKPIIYFHTSMLPPCYGDGMMNYKEMGFGQIVSNEDELINEIKKLFTNKFINDEKYSKRINDFFEYLDYNNCKRIYEVVESEKNDR